MRCLPSRLHHLHLQARFRWLSIALLVHACATARVSWHLAPGDGAPGMLVCCPWVGALTGIRASGQGPAGWAGGHAPRPQFGSTRIGWSNPDWNVRMPNPDWERARSNPDREHGRVKSETGKGGTRKRRRNKTRGCWFLPRFLPAAFNCVVFTGQQNTLGFTKVLPRSASPWFLPQFLKTSVGLMVR